MGERCGILRATPRQVNKHGDFQHIINWGSSERLFQGQYINDPDRVAVASNKLLCARVWGETTLPVPDYTEDREQALEWLTEGHSVLARTLLRANSGRGLVLVHPGNELPNAPLYTRYVKKADEYRVHVFKGQVIDVQQKRKRQEVPNEEVNYQIRNSSNGWVYCRSDVQPADAVLLASVEAVDVLGLDFGAVDIGWNRHNEQACLYEVNTAPGLEGSTLDSYYDKLTEVFPQIEAGAYLRRRNQTN